MGLSLEPILLSFYFASFYCIYHHVLLSSPFVDYNLQNASFSISHLFHWFIQWHHVVYHCDKSMCTVNRPTWCVGFYKRPFAQTKCNDRAANEIHFFDLQCITFVFVWLRAHTLVLIHFRVFGASAFSFRLSLLSINLLVALVCVCALCSMQCIHFNVIISLFRNQNAFKSVCCIQPDRQTDREMRTLQTSH